MYRKRKHRRHKKKLLEPTFEIAANPQIRLEEICNRMMYLKDFPAHREQNPRYRIEEDGRRTLHGWGMMSNNKCTLHVWFNEFTMGCYTRTSKYSAYWSHYGTKCRIKQV